MQGRPESASDPYRKDDSKNSAELEDDFANKTLPSSGLSKCTFRQTARWPPHACQNRCEVCVIFAIVFPACSEGDLENTLFSSFVGFTGKNPLQKVNL